MWPDVFLNATIQIMHRYWEMLLTLEQFATPFRSARFTWMLLSGLFCGSGLRVWTETIQIGAIKHYFLILLLSCTRLVQFLSLWIKSLTLGECHWAVPVVLSFEIVDEIVKRDHSNETYWSVLVDGAVQWKIMVSKGLFKRVPKTWLFPVLLFRLRNF